MLHEPCSSSSFSKNTFLFFIFSPKRNASIACEYKSMFVNLKRHDGTRRNHFCHLSPGGDGCFMFVTRRNLPRYARKFTDNLHLEGIQILSLARQSDIKLVAVQTARRHYPSEHQNPKTFHTFPVSSKNSKRYSTNPASPRLFSRTLPCMHLHTVFQPMRRVEKFQNRSLPLSPTGSLKCPVHR